ncbi:hypothetical protein BDZ94DRAFT_1317956 [Collybia nuda]|uniref:Terpenoid synthase n=1 Tax=Collybia nuda TaxID=64659 RepID=A0A9P5YI68_9AGAR|nr:hypothetical protein BDZ94DRAFT_1317956 [Collybia nuda]
MSTVTQLLNNFVHVVSRAGSLITPDFLNGEFYDAPLSDASDPPAKDDVTDLMVTVGQILSKMLHDCHIPYCAVSFDYGLMKAPVAEAERRGYALEGPNSMRQALFLGVYLTSTMYAHVTDDEALRTYITFYIMFMFYVDDKYFEQSDKESGLLHFIARFNQNQPQAEPSLTNFADFLRDDTAAVFEPIGGGIIITSTLNFINGMILETSVKLGQISPYAQNFPYFVRNKSGFPEACVILAFPRDMPVRQYAQAFPEICDYLCYVNDIMSFYKEELVGETENLVSLLAAVTDSKVEHLLSTDSPAPVTRNDKYGVLRRLSAAVASGHKKTLQILSGNPIAQDIYLKFAIQYVTMYISMRERYKLDELRFGDKA